MKTWITLKDGRVNDIVTTPDDNQPSFGSGWNEVPHDWKGNHGDKLDWFDSDMRRIPDQELVKQGKRKDNRGRVFNTKNMSSRIIHFLDEPLGEDETKEAPLENEPFQVFDKSEKKWVINETKKEHSEKETALAELKAQIDDAERRTLRPLRAKEMGRATPEDLAVLDRYDSLIEKELRPKVDKLELELAELKKSA